nr:uncharacterized protein LOC129380987 [Dermacentor andersoni]
MVAAAAGGVTTRAVATLGWLTSGKAPFIPRADPRSAAAVVSIVRRLERRVGRGLRRGFRGHSTAHSRAGLSCSGEKEIRPKDFWQPQPMGRRRQRRHITDAKPAEASQPPSSEPEPPGPPLTAAAGPLVPVTAQPTSTTSSESLSPSTLAAEAGATADAMQDECVAYLRELWSTIPVARARYCEPRSSTMSAPQAFPPSRS